MTKSLSSSLMAGQIDPYHRWLGIPPSENPPSFYRLLGLVEFEADADVIQEASDRQMAHVKRHEGGPHSPESQRLLNELSLATVTLLHPMKKQQYDNSLRLSKSVKAGLTAKMSPAKPSPVPPVAALIPPPPAERPPAPPTRITVSPPPPAPAISPPSTMAPTGWSGQWPASSSVQNTASAPPPTSRPRWRSARSGPTSTKKRSNAGRFLGLAAIAAVACLATMLLGVAVTSVLERGNAITGKRDVAIVPHEVEDEPTTESDDDPPGGTTTEGEDDAGADPDDDGTAGHGRTDDKDEAAPAVPNESGATPDAKTNNRKTTEINNGKTKDGENIPGTNNNVIVNGPTATVTSNGVTIIAVAGNGMWNVSRISSTGSRVEVRLDKQTIVLEDLRLKINDVDYGAVQPGDQVRLEDGRVTVNGQERNPANGAETNSETPDPLQARAEQSS